MRRTTSETADFVIDRIRALGFDPHPQSRLMRMRDVLFNDGAPKALEPDDPSFAIALEALRDLLHFGFIFDHLDPSPESQAHRRLSVALRDCILPQENLEQSPGRDAQFELYIAAICTNARLLPVTFAEPDLNVVVNAPDYSIRSQSFGIAAKRLKSIDNFEKNIRKAANQIKSAGLPGIIATDTCVALNRDNESFVAPLMESEFRKGHGAALRHFIDAHHTRLQDWVRTKGVRAIILHDHQRWLHPEFGWTLMSMTMAVDTSRENYRRKREYIAFWERYQRGLPTRD